MYAPVPLLNVYYTLHTDKGYGLGKKYFYKL